MPQTGTSGVWERLYERDRRRYVAVYIAWEAIATCVLVALMSVAGWAYLSGRLSALAPVLAFNAACLAPAVTARALLSRRDLGPAIAWVDSERSAAGAEAALRALRTRASHAFLQGILILGAASIPALVYARHVWHLALAWVPPVWLGLLLGIVAILMAVFFTGERILQPVTRDVAGVLGADASPVRVPMPMRLRLVLAFSLVSAMVAMFVGTFESLGIHGPASMVLTMVVAIVTVATLALPVINSIADVVLVPIGEMVAATQRVAADDYATPVRVLGTDELGVLASSFNTMLAGLREREVLRSDNEELTASLRASRARIVAAADDERRRIERDLHDGAQQHLVLLGARLGVARRMLDAGDPAAVRAVHEELLQDVDRALAELRDLANGIYPAALESSGLPAALRDVAVRSTIPVELRCDGTTRQSREIEAAVYFCCLEALQNASKHAGEATRAVITLSQDDGALHFEVTDDGRGFDAAFAQRNAGLRNMTDRIGALGGTLTVVSKPGAGTTVSGSLPVASG